MFCSFQQRFNKFLLQKRHFQGSCYKFIFQSILHFSHVPGPGGATTVPGGGPGGATTIGPGGVTTIGPGGVTTGPGGVTTGPGSATSVTTPLGGGGPVGGIITEVVGVGFSVVRYLILLM